MKILVTGSNGFIGSHLVNHLYEQGPGCQDWGLNLQSYKVQLEVGKTDDWEDAASASITF